VSTRIAVFAAAASLALGSAAPAGAAGLPGFSLAAETRRVAFYTRGTAKIDARGVEASLSRIEKALGQPLRRKAAYYRYASAQEIAAGTGYYAAGITYPGEVHSIEPRHDHELVHLVAVELGQPGRFFHEGLAVAMTGERTLPRGQVKRAMQRSRQPVSAWVLGFDRYDPALAYAVAGSFVKHLVEAHGLPRVVSFFRACRPGADVRAAFSETFGVALDDAGDAWRSSL
jgi:hypothetical protein